MYTKFCVYHSNILLFILQCPLRISYDLFGYFQYRNVIRNENILKSGKLLLHIRMAESIELLYYAKVRVQHVKNVFESIRYN